jgi:REP element-mobilizing transposase RayT
MLRGINQTQLFYDDEDRMAFLGRVERYKHECGFLLYAYCLMGNHVHLLLQPGDVTLAKVMQRLTLSYSSWFNNRYDRSGYLFQGRFRSEPINGDAYFLAVVRYIHNNPVQIGESINSWTSYGDYMDTPVLVDTDFVLSLFDADTSKARRLLDEFLQAAVQSGPDASNGDASSILDMPTAPRLRRPSDAEAIELIKAIASIDTCIALSHKGGDARNKYLAALKQKGLSVRQLSRLTGINRGIVQKA